jgi:hypothetical protein
MRLVLLAIQMLVLVLPSIAEDPLSRYLDSESVQKLRAGGSVRASVTAGERLALVPAVSSREDLAADLKAVNPTVGVEMLKLIHGSADGMDRPDQWLRTYNLLHSVSSMKGITYYSVTRKKEQVLFTQSYAISSIDNPRPIVDPVFETIPADDVLLTFQEDNSFGKNSYQESFRFRTDHLVVKIENLTTVSFLLVPVVSPRNLVSQIVLVRVGPDLLFYGLAYIRSRVPIGDRHSREDSLANRLTAVESWLRTRLATGGAP